MPAGERVQGKGEAGTKGALDVEARADAARLWGAEAGREAHMEGKGRRMGRDTWGRFPP